MTPHITMDPAVPFPRSWKDPMGKRLTDRRIAHYQKLGLLSVSGLLLPKDERATGPVCSLCGVGHRSTRHRVVSFLPCGNYCDQCYTEARDSRDKAEALARLIRQQSFIYE